MGICTFRFSGSVVVLILMMTFTLSAGVLSNAPETHFQILQESGNSLEEVNIFGIIGLIVVVVFCAFVYGTRYGFRKPTSKPFDHEVFIPE